MPRFMIERTVLRLIRPDDRRGAAGCARIVAVNAEKGVTWLHSCVSPDKTRTYCVYDAASAEAIREVAHMNTLAGGQHHRGLGARPVFLSTEPASRARASSGGDRLASACGPLPCRRGPAALRGVPGPGLRGPEPRLRVTRAAPRPRRCGRPCACRPQPARRGPSGVLRTLASESRKARSASSRRPWRRRTPPSDWRTG